MHPNWLESSEGKGVAMPELRTPRWNASEALMRLGESQDRPSARALEHARQIARLIERENSPSPFVFPTDIGGVQFEWKGTSRELDLEVLPDTERLCYLTIIDGEPRTEGEIVDDYERQVIALLNWLRWR